MRVFVTGGAGFIGSYFARSLLANEYPFFADADVTVFDKLTYAGNLDNLAPIADHLRYRFILGDICSGADLDAALPEQDVVVNFAAETHVDRSLGGVRIDYATTNVVGAQQLFEACVRHEIPRVVHVSTDEVYGPIQSGSSREAQLPEPNSPYAATKAGSDHLARAYSLAYDLNVSVTRCTNNYGPYQFPEKMISLLITNLLDGRPVALYGKGQNTRDWLYVADHCRALALVAENGQPGEFYNIGGGQELSNRELTQLVLDATGRDWSYVDNIADPGGGGDDLRYSIDYSKIVALGYAPRVPFAVGLAKTVNWYRENRPWWESLEKHARRGR